MNVCSAYSNFSVYKIRREINKMKRKIQIVVMLCLISIFTVVPVKASDSATISGGGFTLYGSISNTTLSGSATGTYGSSVTVSV